MRISLIGVCLAFVACTTPVAPEPQETPIVIAHRGASGELPEHTIEAYARAIEQGADWIEPDLVMTRDGVMVARHDPYLSDSTNVADIPEFANRKRTVESPDGVDLTDWWVWDFTYKELQSLSARQVREGRSKAYDDQFAIPTLEEIIALVQDTARQGGRSVGIYAETKWPTDHAQRGLSFAAPLIETLTRHGYTAVDAPFIVQSFEPGILQHLNGEIDTRLVQLVWPEGWVTGGEPSYTLDELAPYADGVGPYKAMVIDQDTGRETGYAAQARELGLDVHPWTFRDDDLPAIYATPEAEIRAVIKAGANGVFTDFPATGRRAVDAMAKAR